MFVNDHEETVSDGRNTLWIKAKMDIRTAGLVSADLARFGASTILAHEVCLLRRNIVRWAGPDFTGEDGKIIPCTPERIDQLDPNEPIVAEAVGRIRELNKRKEEPAPAVNGQPAAESEPEHPTPAAVAT